LFEIGLAVVREREKCFLFIKRKKCMESIGKDWIRGMQLMLQYPPQARRHGRLENIPHGSEDFSKFSKQTRYYRKSPSFPLFILSNRQQLATPRRKFYKKDQFKCLMNEKFSLN